MVAARYLALYSLYMNVQIDIVEPFSSLPATSENVSMYSVYVNANLQVSYLFPI